MCYRPALTAVVIAVVLALSTPVHAQTRATAADLVGLVTDATNAVLPGAVVTATNIETNQSRVAISQSDGRFSILALPPGTYQVSVDLPSFARAVREGVTLALGAQVDLAFSLQLAGTTEAITVTGEAPLVDARRPRSRPSCRSQQIESLPIDGRNFISFAVITPGVSTDRTPQQGASATSGLTFAGQRARSNNITVDGLDNNDAVRGQRAGDLQSGGGARVPGAHQLVLRRVRQRHRRRAEHRDQERHQPVHRQRVRASFATTRSTPRGISRKFDPSGEPVDLEKAPYSQEQFGGDARRPDPERQDLLLPVCSSGWTSARATS